MKQTTLQMSAVYSLINDYVDNLQGADLHFITEHMHKDDAEMARRLREYKINTTSVFYEKYTTADVLDMVADAVMDDEVIVKYVSSGIKAPYTVIKKVEGVGRVMKAGQSHSEEATALHVVIGKEFDSMGNIERLYTRSVFLA